MKPTIAIILTFNDLEKFRGGTRQGLKQKISYFDQFLMLYESVRCNWRQNKFDYMFLVLHSLPFSGHRLEVFRELDVIVETVTYDKHKTKIRPKAYTIDLDVDYRMILDNDMVAFNEPDLDFNKDILGMYGGNKYNKLQWRYLCSRLACPLPKQPVLKLRYGNYDNWNMGEHIKYQSGKLKKLIFPYFNNGAILVKNEISRTLGNNWEELRTRYNDIQSEKGYDIDLDGQDVIGLAANQASKQWGVFPIGFNYIVNDKFSESRDLSKTIESKDISLLHYVNISESNPFYPRVEYWFSLVRDKYY